MEANKLNTLKINDKVEYNGEPAVVVDFADPFGPYPAVVIERKALFADFGPSYLQKERCKVIEYGLTKLN